jgi:hypothetical protein
MPEISNLCKDLGVLPPCRNCLREHLKRVNYQVGIWKRAHIAKPVYPEPTHDNGWQCVDGMIEPKWVSGDFIPQQLADVLVEENIAGLTESDGEAIHLDQYFLRHQTFHPLKSTFL